MLKGRALKIVGPPCDVTNGQLAEAGVPFSCFVQLHRLTKDQWNGIPKTKSLWMNKMMMIRKDKTEDFQPDEADPESRKSIQLLCKRKQANS